MASLLDNCDDIRPVHFAMEFYGDSGLSELVDVVYSNDYPEYFFVDGGPIASTGGNICMGQCHEVSFQLPSSAPSRFDALFNRRLFARLRKPVISSFYTNLQISDGFKTNIIFVVDESGSMKTEHDWLPDTIQSIEERMIDFGIGPNTYTLIGFGVYPSVDADLMRVHLNKVTAEQAADYISAGGLVTNGRTEDGYAGIDLALSSLSYTGPKAVILITDEDRDNATSNTYQDMVNYLDPTDTTFSAIVNADFGVTAPGQCIENTFEIVDGVVENSNTLQYPCFPTTIFGVDKDGNGYVEPTFGADFARGQNGAFITGAGSTKAHYIDLAWDVDGIAWSLNILRNGGDSAQQFTSAFVQSLVDAILETFVCTTSEQFSAVQNWFCPRDETDHAVRINLFDGSLFTDAVHYRATFYSDPERTRVAHTAFSLNNQRGWFIENEPLYPITTDGVMVENGNAPSVLYYPEILPIEDFERQRDERVTASETEMPLLCGVKYYVDFDYYRASTGDFVNLGNTTYMVSCDTVKSNIWRVDEDAKNWASSGQGRSDKVIAQTQSQAIFPTVAANFDSQFVIAWQDHRNITTDLTPNAQVYYGIWDISRDIIWSSGQGNYDRRVFPKAYRPKLLLDNAGILYFTARRTSEVTTFAGPVETDTTATTSCLLTDSKFLDIDDTLSAGSQYLKARVHEPYQIGSFVVRDGDAISVVDDCMIRLDVVGVPNAYAVRARNETDSDWSDWISIDEDRPAEATGKDEDSYISAHFIDQERFLLPWFLSGGNGMKKVTLQILTWYGVTPPFSLDVLSNASEMNYSVEFFTDSGLTTSASTFNGYPVVGSGDDNNLVYIKATFSDTERLALHLDTLAQYNRFAGIKESDGTLTFNVIQQGVNDQFGLTLTAGSEEGVYTGSFEVEKSDGIYNKDGLAAIVVNVPNPCTKTQDKGCGTELDPYNAMNLSLLRDFYAKYDSFAGDINPEQLLSEYRASGLAQTTGISSLKEFYDADDPRYMFGNPRFFINKGN